ncbi:MAG: hypothetical protein HZB47_02610 [Nitrosomonadales bacterium]|nr:hypothetical protein [Nitrosomonadales bacterium]
MFGFVVPAKAGTQLNKGTDTGLRRYEELISASFILPLGWRAGQLEAGLLHIAGLI